MLFKIWKKTKSPKQYQIKAIVVSEFDFSNDTNHPLPLELRINVNKDGVVSLNSQGREDLDPGSTGEPDNPQY